MHLPRLQYSAMKIMDKIKVPVQQITIIVGIFNFYLSSFFNFLPIIFILKFDNN